MDFQYDVFLTHNVANKPRVRRLAERLRAAGLRDLNFTLLTSTLDFGGSVCRQRRLRLSGRMRTPAGRNALQPDVRQVRLPA